jgi:hypothetical protein
MLFPRFVTATVAFELAVAAARVGSSTLTADKFIECPSEFSRSSNPNLDPVLSSTPERASFCSAKAVSRCCNNNAGGACCCFCCCFLGTKLGLLLPFCKLLATVTLVEASPGLNV